MKHKLLWLAAIALTSLNLQAQTVYMQMTNAEIQEFPAISVDNMNFQNNHLQFQLSDGTTQTINFSMVRRLFFDATFGINQLNSLQQELVLFPNPANDCIYLKQKGLSRQTASVYSVSGQQVKSFIIENDETRISLEGLDSGIYFIRCQSINAKMIKL